MRSIVLIGGGGHCKSCIDIIESESKFKITGIIDKKEKIGEKVLNYIIFASDDDIKNLSKDYKNFLITIGQIKTPLPRIDLFMKLKSLDCNLPVIISPLAYISKHSEIDEGTIIMHKAFVNSNVKIGKNCIINTNALIEHDAVIGDYCHVSTGAIINGDCKVESKCFIGSNSVISNGIKICQDCIIGAGSIVINDINEPGIYIGNPARKKYD